MLYQNKTITRKPTNVNIPIVFNNPAPATATATTTANNQAAAEPNQILDINKVNQNGGLNLNIFSSDKFKMLKESESLIKEQPEVGKRDPFKSN